jgi:cysteine rich repeat protein
MPMRRNALLPVLALTTALTAHGTGARADMMKACAPEVSRYCANVSQGRGRIAACLASRMGQLGTACRPEVQAVGQSRLTPGYARKIFDPAFRAPLPQACVAPAAQFCPGMKPGEGQVFACLYAYSDRVGKACSGAAQAALKQSK